MPVYEEKKKVNGQKRYYIRTYITDEFGNKKQITKHNMNWIGRDGYWEAQQEENRLRKKIQKKECNLLFKECCDIFLDNTLKNCKESTWYTYNNDINSIISKMPFYYKKVKDINESDINKFRDYLIQNNYSIEYKNKLHNIMCKILDILVIDLKILDTNIERYYGPFKNNQGEIQTDEEKLKYITYDEFKELIKKENNFQWYCYFHTLFFTGMRKGESLALSWNDIDFENELIIVNKTYSNKTLENSFKITNTKNSKNRKIQLDKKTLKLLEELKNQKIKNNNFNINHFVFGGENPFSTSSITRHWEKLFENTNIQPITIHQLRHSHVSFLINEYVKNGSTDVAKFFLIASNRLGHTISVMQKTYMHLFPTFQQNIVNLINNYTLQDQKQDQKK